MEVSAAPSAEWIPRGLLCARGSRADLRPRRSAGGGLRLRRRLLPRRAAPRRSRSAISSAPSGWSAGWKRSAAKRRALRLANVRVLRLESAYVVKHLLPAGSVSIAHVAFPDPWPKRQHHPRRLVQDDFLRERARRARSRRRAAAEDRRSPVLSLDGKGARPRAGGFERIEWPEEPEYPLTKFERQFLAQGLPIHRARLRKV